MTKLETVGYQIKLENDPVPLLNPDVNEIMKVTIREHKRYPSLNELKPGDSLPPWSDYSGYITRRIIYILQRGYTGETCKDTQQAYQLMRRGQKPVLVIPVFYVKDAGGKIRQAIRDWLVEVCDGGKVYEQSEGVILHSYELMKFHEGLITWEDVLRVQNLELRRRFMEKIGRPEFVRQAKAAGKYSVIDKDEFGSELIEIGTKRFVELQDSSHPQYRYPLEVPPNIQTVHAARAWSFDIDPDYFHPEVET